MTVGELKVQLADVDDTYLVVMSKDSEGNAFSPLAAWADAEYAPETTWYGEVKTPDYDNPQELEDWDPAENKVNAIVLWPVS